MVVDGNMLAGSERRLAATRGRREAALPGKSLAVYECRTGLVLRVAAMGRTHAERAILPHLPVEEGAHHVADRNFCVAWYTEKVEDSGSWFTFRQHRGSFPLDLPAGGWRRRGRCDRGGVGAGVGLGGLAGPGAALARDPGQAGQADAGRG